MRRAMIGTRNFLLDWKNGATLLATVLIALLVVSVVNGITARRDAVNSLAASRAAATRRIDLLQHQIDMLQREAQEGREERGKLTAAILALQVQIERMGGKPIITTSQVASVPIAKRSAEAPRTGPPQPARTPQPTAQPRPSPSRTASPRPTRTPSPSPNPAVCLPLIGCVG